jgi:lipopolysaccharide heptosyltransferase III
LELLRRCALYIGNDSGPAHIAAVVGTPCLTLFSSVLFPGIWELWGEGNVSLRRLDSEFCLCEDYCPRGTMECIREIKVEEVLAVVRKRWHKLLVSDQPGAATDARGPGVGTGKAFGG